MQPIPLSPETAIKVDSIGIKIIGPEDLIPDEVCCSVCGKNILETRYDFCGVLVCPRQDAGNGIIKNISMIRQKGNAFHLCAGKDSDICL